MPDIIEIIEGCKQRNRKAQKVLYETFAPVLLGICIRFTGNRNDAEDILQDAFVKIFFNIEEYSGKGSFINWMKKILINTSITHFHRNFKYNLNVDIDEIFNDETADDETPDKEYSADELLDIIKSLPQGYKMVFNLFAIEGYKHKEIADMLNIDENTSKSQYARARKWIQNRLNRLNKISKPAYEQQQPTH